MQSPVPGLIVHRGRVVSRRDHGRRPGPGRDRRRAPAGHLPLTHGDPPGPPGVPQRARRVGRAGRLGERAGPAALRLHRRRRRAAVGAAATPRTRSTSVLINDLEVRAFVTPIDEARAMGAIALFGEKYGDQVRVVEVGDYSRELCGGTHVARSGQLGLVKILGESSIGSGVRRVEALVGTDAFRFLATESVLVSQLSEQLKARREELPERVAALVDPGPRRRAGAGAAPVRAAARRGRGDWPAAPRTSAGRRSSATGCPTAPPPTASASWRWTSGDGCPPERPAVVDGGRCPGRPADGGDRGQRPRPRAGPDRRMRWSARRRAASAAAAAAATTSPRAAARRSATAPRQRSTRRLMRFVLL